MVYTSAGIVVAVWALASFLPLAGAVMDWGSWWVLAHLAFLSVGFPGLIGGFLVYRWVTLLPARTLEPDERQKLMGFLGVYATLWMTAYSYFAA